MRTYFLVAALTYSLPAVATTSPLSFNAPRTFPVNRPTSLVAGDFDGDGKQDVAIASNENSVIVLLSNGQKYFYPLSSGVQSGPGATPLAVGDFNHDGHLDLAVTGNARNYVSVMLGNGDGTFQTPVAYAVGDTPWAVAVGDFNGDGNPDLVVSNFDDGTVSVLLGNGDGAFQPAVNYSVATYDFPRGVVTADFNQDGNLDIAVATPLSKGVAVLLGNGDGTFQPPISTAAGGTETNVLVTGDFDGDGTPDLAVLASTVVILSGNGDGTFTQKGSYGVGFGAKTLTVGDFNGDGKPDLAAAGNPNYITILSGNGDATFQPGTCGPFSTQAMAAGDFNGDGKLDLAALTPGGPNDIMGSVAILLGNGLGDFQHAPGYIVPASGVAVADFNHDGNLDVVAVGNSANPVTGVLSILLGNGNGSFQNPVGYIVEPSPLSVAVGDFNGDGNPDLAIANVESNLVSVLLGNGDGTFQPAQNYPFKAPGAITVGDFNGDGKLDLAVVQSGCCVSNNFVSILMGNGDGRFKPAVNYPTGYAPTGLAIGDFNGDGKLDLALSCQAFGAIRGNIAILLGNGDGTFQAPVGYPSGPLPVAIAAGDLNGDGKLDLAVALTGGAVETLLGNGDGSFQSPVSYTLPGQGSGVILGDFDGDGKPDLAVSSSDGLSIFLGKGDGTFRPVLSFSCGGSVASLAAGDFNGGGKPAIIAGTAPDLTVLTNTTP